MNTTLSRPASTGHSRPAKLEPTEKGFSLIELVVILSIVAFVATALSMTIITLLRLSPQSNNWAVALHQVQNAGHWIARDVQMSQGEITVGTGNPTFLTLTLPQDPTSNKTIVYQYQDMPDGLKRLMRHDQTAGEELMIAQFISSENTTAVYDSDNYTLTLIITAVCGDVTVTREYQAVQRVPP